MIKYGNTCFWGGAITFLKTSNEKNEPKIWQNMLI